MQKTNVKKVVIYTTPQCSFCHMAKEYFEEKGVAYEEYDVSKDEVKRKEMISQAGMIAVPVIKIGKEIIIGFNKPKINEALGMN